MRKLYNYLLLKQLYKLQTLGYEYTNVEFKKLDEQYSLPNSLEELKSIVSNV